MRLRVLAFVLVLVCATSAAAQQGLETHYPLPQNNASFMPDLQTFLQREDAARYADMFRSFVVSGGVLSPTAGLTGTPTAVTAYVSGYYVTDNASIVFPDDSVCWLVLAYNTNDDLGNFIRVPGTHYLINCIDAGPAAPSLTMFIAEVTTAGGAITAVVDLRVTSLFDAGVLPGSYVFFTLPDTTHTVTMRAPFPLAASYTFTLPPDMGASGDCLKTNGINSTFWDPGCSGGGGGGISGSGAANRVTYWTGAATVSSSSTFTWDPAMQVFSAPTVALPGGGKTVSLVGSGSMAANWTLTLPPDAGTNGWVLVTDGAGNTSWSNQCVGCGIIGTGADTYLTYWNGPTTVTGSSVLTFNAATKALIVTGGQQTIYGLGTGAVFSVIDASNPFGINVFLGGNGVTTPNKWLRVNDGRFDIVNSGYTASILSLTDSGVMTVPNVNGITYAKYYGTTRAAIQAAIDAAPAGGVVQLDCVTYTHDAISISITKALTLRGCGSYGTTITPGAGVSTSAAIAVSTDSAVHFIDFAIDLAAAPLMVGITLDGPTNNLSSTFTRMRFFDGLHQIVTAKALNWTVMSSRFEHYDAAGIKVNNTSNPDQQDSAIVGNQFESAGVSAAGVLITAGAGFRIAGNKFIGGEPWAILVETLCGTGGFEITGNDIASAAIAFNCVPPAGYGGIQIVGNNIDGGPVGGITFAGNGASPSLFDITIIGNSGRAQTGTAWISLHSVDGVVIANNILRLQNVVGCNCVASAFVSAAAGTAVSDVRLDGNRYVEQGVTFGAAPYSGTAMRVWDFNGLTLARAEAWENGSLVYCSDCNEASTPCTSGGTGAFARRRAGAWAC